MTRNPSARSTTTRAARGVEISLTATPSRETRRSTSSSRRGTLAKTNHQPSRRRRRRRRRRKGARQSSTRHANAPPREPGDARDDRATTATTAQRSTSRVVAREVRRRRPPARAQRPPGRRAPDTNLDTDRPRLRTIDGARYVGRYELTVGEQLIVGFPNARDADARVLATTERRVRFTPASATVND